MNRGDLMAQKLNNTAIIVLGMHRSGTSAISGVLHRLGVDLGSDLMPPQEDNPKGFYEHNKLTELNESILNALGSSWDDPRALPPQWSQNVRISPLRERLKFILLNEFKESHLWALKDPRISRLLDLWLPLLDELGVNIKILFALRHPSEVADSLLIRNQIPSSQSLLLWLRYTLEGEKRSRVLSRTFQFYSDVLSDWRASFRRIEAELFLEWPRTLDSVASEVDDFLVGSLRHHENESDDQSVYCSHYHRIAQLVYASMHSLGAPQAVSFLEECDTNLIQLEEKVAAYNAYIESVRNKLENTQWSLVDTQKILTKTREELNETREELNAIPKKLLTYLKASVRFIIFFRNLCFLNKQNLWKK